MQQELKKSFSEGKPPTLIFAFMAVTNILINLDHGILPACTNELKDNFDMGDTQLGFLGSIVYLGIVIMGVFAGSLYQRVNSKVITLGSLLLLQASLFAFAFVHSKTLAYVCRFVTGGCQVFLLIYYPIWIDKFGGEKKTMWLTLLQICVPLGIFMGYGMTSIIISTGHQFGIAFYVQCVLVFFFIIIFSCMSKKKLDSRRKLSEDFGDFTASFTSDSKTESLLEPTQIDLFEKTLSQKKRQKLKHYTYAQMLKKLFKSKLYLVSTLSMSVILFVSTGLQFWLTDYLINVMHFSRASVNISYAVVSITGPTSGAAFGGYFLTKKGGYENPKVIYYMFGFSTLAITAAVIVPFLDNFYALNVTIWIVFFFGGSLLPGLTGMMMVSVPPYLRAFGNSNGEIIKNSLGFLPSPFLYGWLNTYGDKVGIQFLMFWGILAPILLGWGALYRYKQLKLNTIQEDQKKLEESESESEPSEKSESEPSEKSESEPSEKSESEIENKEDSEEVSNEPKVNRSFTEQEEIPPFCQGQKKGIQIESNGERRERREGGEGPKQDNLSTNSEQNVAK